MRWMGRRESQNVEDRRGMRATGMAVGGGIGGIVVLLIVVLLGGDPSMLLQQQAPDGPPGEQRELSREEQEQKKFVAVVLADTEDVWHDQFRKLGKQYVEPKLVLFSGQVNSACGFASAAMGPFYCPPDQRVYIDLSFYDEMKQRLGGGGDFAMAYVIAHEVGHHVQNLLGTSDKVHRMQGRVGKAEYNQASVRLELQADFYAGLWAHHAQRMRNILEAGDIDEAVNTAAAIGDDRLQRQSQGHVVPDSFTHGTSEQRVRWFQRGFKTGDMRQGDTFSVPYGEL